MTGGTPTSAKLSFNDALGQPLANGTLTVYLAGTTTPTNTWQDLAQTTLNTNPIVLDARGECVVFLDDALAYKFLLRDSTGATIWTVDNILPAGGGGGGDISALQAQVDAIQLKTNRLVWVDDYGTNTVPGTTNMAAAILAAIAAVGSGGRVLFLNTDYNTLSELVPSGYRGVTLEGVAGGNELNGTRIIGTHTGRSVLSLAQCGFFKLRNIQLFGSSASRPKVGLLLGTDTNDEIGRNHVFDGVYVRGSYTVAGLYNIGSRDNSFYNCIIEPDAAPYAGMYMCTADGNLVTALGGLQPSNLLNNNFYNCTIGNDDDTAGATGLYIDLSDQNGTHGFYGVKFTKRGGDSFIKLRVGQVGGNNSLLGMTFSNCHMNPLFSSVPTTGVNIESVANVTLGGLTMDMVFDPNSTNAFLCNGAGTGTLVNARLSSGGTNGTGPVSTFQTLQGCDLRLFRESGITIGTASGCTITSNATPIITSQLGANAIVSAMTFNSKLQSYLFAGRTLAVTKSTIGNLSIDASQCNVYICTNTFSGGFVVNNPTNSSDGQLLTLIFVNLSLAPINITFDTDYENSGTMAITNGFTRVTTFANIANKWYEIARGAEYN